MKTRTDLNLGDVFCLSIIYHIPDSWLNLLNSYDFYLRCKPPIGLLISGGLFCKLVSSAHTTGHVVKQRQVPSCATEGRMWVQEACAHEAKRLLLNFYVEAEIFVRALHSMHILNIEARSHFVPALWHTYARMHPVWGQYLCGYSLWNLLIRGFFFYILTEFWCKYRCRRHCAKFTG